MAKTIVSAPGKVLLCGGYLILEPNLGGLVVAVTARLQTEVVVTGQALDLDALWVAETEDLKGKDEEEKEEEGLVWRSSVRLGSVPFRASNTLVGEGPQDGEDGRPTDAPELGAAVHNFANEPEDCLELHADITVVSTQYGTSDTYHFTCLKEGRCCSLQGAPSPFIRECVLGSLAVVCGYYSQWNHVYGLLNGTRIQIALRGDNSFYSQSHYLEKMGLQVTASTVASVPPHNADIMGSDGQVCKTGLGSSACLTTSLVGALLQHFGVATLPSREIDAQYSSMAVGERGAALP
eukprot:NODE_911_length_1241_cov_95.212248_g679_i0.p1 GENE.NODE_911_length_1241_cov_95.212248_g679_i0~~NODE_911_length_1241_cov_95.212248_g679_i0.p1  ORF type:complete len:293 (-),score=34.74 NODE_911_length_1241_cov_95.212248_g679_i0:301-1179(-)